MVKRGGIIETVIIYKNDINFSRDFLLKNSDGTPYDLTSHIVKFKMTSVYGGTAKIDASATIVAPEEDGRVRYTFIGTDTDSVDRFHAEVETNETTTGKILTWRVASVEVRPTV